MRIERICYYLSVAVVIELLSTLVALLLVTNLHPYWMQLLAFPYLPIIDVVTIVIWLTCRILRDRST